MWVFKSKKDDPTAAVVRIWLLPEFSQSYLRHTVKMSYMGFLSQQDSPRCSLTVYVQVGVVLHPSSYSPS